MEARDRVRGFLSGMPFYAALGMEVVSVEDGRVTIEVPLSKALEAPPGFFAASSVGAIGDVAAMSSVCVALPEGEAMTTMDFTIKMLGLSRGRRLRAIGRPLQIGKTTCVGAADIYVIAEDKPVLCGSLLATGRRLGNTWGA